MSHCCSLTVLQCLTRLKVGLLDVSPSGFDPLTCLTDLAHISWSLSFPPESHRDLVQRRGSGPGSILEVTQVRHQRGLYGVSMLISVSCACTVWALQQSLYVLCMLRMH